MGKLEGKIALITGFNAKTPGRKAAKGQKITDFNLIASRLCVLASLR